MGYVLALQIRSCTLVSHVFGNTCILKRQSKTLFSKASKTTKDAGFNKVLLDFVILVHSCMEFCLYSSHSQCLSGVRQH